jgi:hypothetical protein
MSCRDPADDAACDTAYGDGFICNSGSCAEGCRVTSDCAGEGAELCSAQLACVPCTEDAAGDAACTVGYGTVSVCVAGACRPGTCRTAADCAGSNPGFLCVNNQCAACTGNAGCQTDATHGASTICHVAAGAQQGQCVANTCANPGAACSANPSVNFCCAGNGGPTCVTGNCCGNADCGFGQVCTTNQCVLCNQVIDGNFFVDPVSGSNAAGITGSATCPWKTITHALAQLTGTSQPATINVRATGDVSQASGETFPIGVLTTLANGGGHVRIVPANRTIRGAGAEIPTIKVPTGSYGFALAAASSRLSQMVIDSADVATVTVRGNHGVQVFQGSATTTVIDHLTVRNMRYAGIRVHRTGAGTQSGVLTINGGVSVTGCGGAGGLHLYANGVATINGGTGTDVVSFQGNTGWGIYVQDLAAVTINGQASFPVPVGEPEGTVIVKGNTSGGVFIGQCVANAALWIATNGGPALVDPDGDCAATLDGLASPPPANVITGLAVWNNGPGNVHGFRIEAGSSVKIRNSVSLGNGRAGVVIANGPNRNVANGAPPPTNWSYGVFDLSLVDLGTGADPGRNLLQTGWTGGTLNGGSGIQMSITQGRGQVLRAAGNRLQENTRRDEVIDCAATTGVVSANTSVSTCWTGDPLEGVAVCGNLTGANANTLDLTGCTVP